MIRTILAAAGLAVLTAGCNGLVTGTPTPSPSGPPTATEVLAQKVVTEQLTKVCTDAPTSQICPAVNKKADGSWDITAASRILTVQTSIRPNQFSLTFAQNACVLIADWVRDPDTQKPLDMIGVIIQSGDLMMANCRLPKT